MLARTLWTTLRILLHGMHSWRWRAWGVERWLSWWYIHSRSTWTHKMRRLAVVWMWWTSMRWSCHRWSIHSHWWPSWSCLLWRAIWWLPTSKWRHRLISIHLLLRMIICILLVQIILILKLHFLLCTFVLSFSTSYLEISFPFRLKIF